MCVCYRYKESHVVTARAAVTVIHPELGCLISSTELQNYSIILLYAEEGSSPGQNILPLVTERWADVIKAGLIAGWVAAGGAHICPTCSQMNTAGQRNYTLDEEASAGTCG